MRTIFNCMSISFLCISLMYGVIKLINATASPPPRPINFPSGDTEAQKLTREKLKSKVKFDQKEMTFKAIIAELSKQCDIATTINWYYAEEIGITPMLIVKLPKTAYTGTELLDYLLHNKKSDSSMQTWSSIDTNYEILADGSLIIVDASYLRHLVPITQFYPVHDLLKYSPRKLRTEEMGNVLHLDKDDYERFFIDQEINQEDRNFIIYGNASQLAWNNHWVHTHERPGMFNIWNDTMVINARASYQVEIVKFLDALRAEIKRVEALR